jgi:HSP20 family protein
MNFKKEDTIVAIMKWTPPKKIERYFEEFFEEPLFPSIWRKFPKWGKLRGLEGISPSVDMYDKKDEIVVKAEIPGVEQENISIYLTNHTISIKGEIKKEEEVKESDYHYCERSYGSFARALTLPAKVQTDKVKASFENGILEIHLPKAEEAKPKEVKIEDSMAGVKKVKASKKKQRNMVQEKMLKKSKKK